MELPDQKADQKNQDVRQIEMDLSLLKSLDFEQHLANTGVDPGHEAVQNRVQGMRLKMTLFWKITGGFDGMDPWAKNVAKESRGKLCIRGGGVLHSRRRQR